MSVVAETNCGHNSGPNTPSCCLPGCGHAVDTIGQPCTCCRAAFGPMLRQATTPPALEAAQPASLQARPPGRTAARAPAAAGAKERKPNQLCWMCEQRRICTREEHGWECVECQQIT